MRILIALLISLICHSVYAQKETFWFEPDFNKAYAIHNMLYRPAPNTMNRENLDFTAPTHISSFISEYARKNHIKTIERRIRKQGEVFNLYMLQDEAVEYFIYDKKGRLQTYKTVSEKNNHAHQVVYNYTKHGNIIEAVYASVPPYTDVTECTRIIYSYNKGKISGKQVYLKLGFADLYEYKYDSLSLLREVNIKHGDNKWQSLKKYVDIRLPYESPELEDNIRRVFGIPRDSSLGFVNNIAIGCNDPSRGTCSPYITLTKTSDAIFVFVSPQLNINTHLFLGTLYTYGYLFDHNKLNKYVEIASTSNSSRDFRVYEKDYYLQASLDSTVNIKLKLGSNPEKIYQNIDVGIISVGDYIIEYKYQKF